MILLKLEVFISKVLVKDHLGKVDQWRWRCSHQKALYLAKLFLPYATVKEKDY